MALCDGKALRVIPAPDGEVSGGVANSPTFPGCSGRSSTRFLGSAKLRGEAQANQKVPHLG